MMESYWPTAAQQPGAGKHERQHAEWYKNAHKVVLSNTLNEAEFTNTTVIGKGYATAIRKLKENTTGEILLFGSPTTAHSLLAEGLIDECWLFINPVLLGSGIPVFKDVKQEQSLKLLKTHVFETGVICVQHEIQHEK